MEEIANFVEYLVRALMCIKGLRYKLLHKDSYINWCRDTYTNFCVTSCTKMIQVYTQLYTNFCIQIGIKMYVYISRQIGLDAIFLPQVLSHHTVWRNIWWCYCYSTRKIESCIFLLFTAFIKSLIHIISLY